MDCRISGSSTCKKTFDVPFFSNCVPSEYIPRLNIRAYLVITLCQLSVHWRFKPLPMMVVTSVYLSLPLAGMHDQRKCLTCFLFSSMRTDFLFGESFQAITDSSCSYSCSHSQLFPHHLLQSWLNVQTHLILPSSI